MKQALRCSSAVLALMLLVWGVGSWLYHRSTFYGLRYDMAILHVLSSQDPTFERAYKLLRAHPELEETVPLGGYACLCDASGERVTQLQPFEKGTHWRLEFFVLAGEGLQATELVIDGEHRIPITQLEALRKKFYHLEAELPVEALPQESGERCISIAVGDAPAQRFREAVHVSYGAVAVIEPEPEKSAENER